MDITKNYVGSAAALSTGQPIRLALKTVWNSRTQNLPWATGTHPSCPEDEIMNDVNCNNDHNHLLAGGIPKESGGQGVKWKLICIVSP